MLKMKGMRFPKGIILVCIRWYAAYALSYRNLEEMLAGIELMHMIRKGQMITADENHLSFANQFYALAGELRPAALSSTKISVMRS